MEGLVVFLTTAVRGRAHKTNQTQHGTSSVGVASAPHPVLVFLAMDGRRSGLVCARGGRRQVVSCRCSLKLLEMATEHHAATEASRALDEVRCDIVTPLARTDSAPASTSHAMTFSRESAVGAEPCFLATGRRGGKMSRHGRRIQENSRGCGSRG